MKFETDLISSWEIIMGSAAAVLEAIKADSASKPDVVLGYLEKARNETSAANVMISRIIEERRKP